MRIFLPFLAAFFAFVVAATAEDVKPPAVFPVDDIKPGLTGTTYTVMQGTQIVPIHTEVYGLLRNAVGPGHHLIIARLNDEKTKLTFAVHGMSGSPLYIDGKIVGALSRRVVAFEKDAFCGFTPIQDMLDVDKEAAAEPPKPTPSPAKKLAGLNTWFKPMAGSEGMTFEPLLTPLVISGVPPRAFPVWARQFGNMNFLPVMGAGDAGGQAKTIDTPFEPGAPVTALLARGAFNIGGTGTMTYRNGNKIYAFGHPMLFLGAVKVPMARAEIIATVPSYSYPYKISNIGQVIGTITQDRLTAISGEIGTMPRMIPMSVEVINAAGKAKSYPMELFDNQLLTARLVGSVFATVTLLSLDYTEEFSMTVDSEIELDGLPSVKTKDFVSGDEDARFETMIDVVRNVDDLYNSPLGEAKIKKISLKLALDPQRHEFAVEDVWISKDTAKPGETLDVRVTLRAYKGDTRVETIPITLPEELKGGEVKLLVGDADTMRRAELGWSPVSSEKSVLISFFQPKLTREKPRTLAQLVELMNKSRPHNFLYYRLSRVTPGELVQNQRLTALPPSSMAVRESRRFKDDSTKLNEAELFEKRIPIDGVLKGSAELTLKIE